MTKYRNRKTTIAAPEDAIQASFIQWVALTMRPPCRVWHVPNGLGRFTNATAAKGKRLGVTAGVSDVHVMWPGGFGVIEFKAANGELTDAQVDYIGDVEGCGHRAGVARSLDEAIALVTAWGALKGMAAYVGRVG